MPSSLPCFYAFADLLSLHLITFVMVFPCSIYSAGSLTVGEQLSFGYCYDVCMCSVDRDLTAVLGVVVANSLGN